MASNLEKTSLDRDSLHLHRGSKEVHFPYMKSVGLPELLGFCEELRLTSDIELIQNVVDTTWHNVCTSNVAISIGIIYAKPEMILIIRPLSKLDASAKTRCAV